MSESCGDVKVVHCIDGDVREGNLRMLDDVGCTWEQLQAQDGCFESEQARDVWLVISSFESATAWSAAPGEAVRWRISGFPGRSACRGLLRPPPRH